MVGTLFSLCMILGKCQILLGEKMNVGAIFLVWIDRSVDMLIRTTRVSSYEQTKFKSLSRILLTIWAENWPKNSYGSHVIIFLYKKDDTMIPCMIILVNCAVICIADVLMIFGLIKQKVLPCLYWTISTIEISSQIYLYFFGKKTLET